MRIHTLVCYSTNTMSVPAQYRFTGRTSTALVEEVEAAVRHGELAPGTRLPTVRRLATELGVSPTTVAAAYRELRRRGATVADGRHGTRIRTRSPLTSRVPPAVPPGARDLTSGAADPELLPDVPAVPWARRSYGEPPVHPGLRQVAGPRLDAEGIEPAHLAVVGGALDGVERVLRTWTAPGDRVAVEEPGYSAVLDLVAAMGLQAVPVRMDGLGMRGEELRRALGEGVRAVVTTPRAQNPTGAAWDAERVAELHALLQRWPDVGVIEDDHAGPVAGTPEATLGRRNGPWATIRSVSKWLGPDFRLAVLAGDERTVAEVEGRQALGPGWVSWHVQATVAAMWDDDTTMASVARAAEVYAERRRALADAFGNRMPPPVGRSGLTAWAPVEDEAAATAALAEEGWALTPGERFRQVTLPAVRIGLATLRPEEAPALVAALDRVAWRHPYVRVD